MGWLFNRKSRRAARSEGGVYFAGRYWAWEDLARHTLFLGGVGSGKTFSSNDLIRALMEAGCPILATCVKPDDFERLHGIAKSCGHASRVVEITPTSKWRMNLLDQLGMPNRSAPTIAELLMLIGDVGKNGEGSSGRDGGEFWKVQSARGKGAAINLCWEVTGKADIPDIQAVVMSTPGSHVEYQTLPEWDDASDIDANGKPITRRRCAALLREARKRGIDTPEFRNARDYLTKELGGGGDRMRGGVIAEVNNTLGRFIDRPWVEALSGETTLNGQMIEEQGLIAILNYPTMAHHTPARMWQFAWTMDAQRHAMRRDASKVNRPFILLRDEIGQTLHPRWDSNFCLVSRSQKCGCVDIVQDLSTLHMAIGGNAEAEVNSFCANHVGATICFGTRDLKTAKWMSALLGEHREIMISGGGGGKGQPTGNTFDDLLGVGSDFHFSEQFRPVMAPAEFTRLKIGEAVMLAGDSFQFVNFWKGKRR